ncbi:hypothetical protein BD779DRAFT_748825 [Infundibulicybe gibba]|nr:hypothetical protein BD779DRAFT_748825 [Infundibulicybe gibba]
MDTDWCLSCDRHFEGSGPYCSTACQSSSSSTDEFIHHPAWVGSKDPAGIIAWAAHIPPGPPRTMNPPTHSPLSSPQSSSTPKDHRPRWQHIAALSIETAGSIGKTSLLSALTDSPIATPVSARPVPVPQPRPSVFTTLATHVRSWVSPSLPPLNSSRHINSPSWPRLTPLPLPSKSFLLPPAHPSMRTTATLPPPGGSPPP